MDDLDIIRRAVPLSEEQVSSEGVRSAIDELARGTASQVTAKRSGRRPRRLLIVALAAVLIPTAAASAYIASTRSGWFGDPAMSTEEPDRSEYLRTDAPDFAAVARTLIPRLALPAGASFERELRRQVRLGREVPALQQSIGVRRTFESYARCAWLADWRVQLRTGDRAKLARALHVLDASLAWPAIVATDGGGVVDAMREENAQARRGDVGAVDQRRLDCQGFDLKGIR